MTVLQNTELFVRNVDTEDWPGFGVGMIAKPTREGGGQTTPDLEIIDSRVVFPATRPKIEAPFRANGSGFFPALTIRVGAFVVNGPQPIRVGEVGRVFRGPVVRALLGPLGVTGIPTPVTMGPCHNDWRVRMQGFGWTHLGRAPAEASLIEDVHYFVMPTHPPTGLWCLSPTDGIGTTEPAWCEVKQDKEKFDPSGGEQSYADVEVHNVQTESVGGGKTIQAKLDALSDRYIVDVEDCDGA